MDCFDEDEYQQAVAVIEEENQRVDVSPTPKQKLGGFTIICLVLNRTIGSGIFITPAKVWNATGSAGASLLLWAACAGIMTCGLLVWLEMGLSVPLRMLSGQSNPRSVPRSGGEKNFIEFMFPNPKFLATSMFGIVFILLGNLSGNALAFGVYVMHAAGVENPEKGHVIGIAVGALTTCILLHICSRRGGIVLNNVFAGFKVLLLLAVSILGFVKLHNRSAQGNTVASQNLSPTTSFAGSSSNVADYIDSFVYIMYTYSGFEQPFYVLSEVARPRKNFPRYTLIAMAIASFLFILINVAYFSIVQKSDIGSGTDIATAFLEDMFSDTKNAQRAMAAMIAVSIFGNILVMTFTASRVKQEIAKEGILPFSLFFATCHSTPFARIQEWFKRRGQPNQAVNNHLEQTPMAALGLHWVSSIFLIAITSMMTPTNAYSVLVSLYAYVIIVGMGFVVSGGVLYMKIFGVPKEALPVDLENRRKWSYYRNFKAWIDPVHIIIYFVACGFILFASFAKPSPQSSYTYARSGIQWYIVPAIGQSSWLWGIIWFLGLHAFMWHLRRRLVVHRVPYIEPDDDDQEEWVQKSELINHQRIAIKRKRTPAKDDFSMYEKA